MMYRYGLMAILLGCSVLAQARSSGPVLDVNLSFAEQRDGIQSALADGKTYAEISQDDRSKVMLALNRIGGALERAGSVQQLKGAQKMQVFNDQELVNTVLTRAAADSRMVCKRERPIGSNRIVSQCMTVAQRNRQREEARNDILNRRTLSPLTTGGM